MFFDIVFRLSSSSSSSSTIYTRFWETQEAGRGREEAPKRGAQKPPNSVGRGKFIGAAAVEVNYGLASNLHFHVGICTFEQLVVVVVAAAAAANLAS